MTASPIIFVDTSLFPLDIISLVLRPSFRTFWTALSISFASLSKFNEYFKAIEKLKIVAIGLAKPLPAISGADPCTGCLLYTSELPTKA